MPLFYLDIMVKESRYTLIIYGVTGDCPALKKILNFIGHNGYDCCWFCYVHGQHVGGKRQYFYQRPIFLRSSRNYLHDSNEACRTKSRVSGHLGKSVVQDLLDVPLPDSIVIDYLHVTLLGHVKSIAVNIYNKLTPLQRSRFNDELKKQPFPHWFKRKFRPFNEFSNVKAVELRNLLFYGLLPFLQTMLPLDKLAHLSLYVSSIRLLHGCSIFGNETGKISEELLSRFYQDHEQYYQHLQNFVLHLHIHYSTMYKNHGSLANIGCFGQEDLIGKIGSNHHGTRYYGDLITYYYNIDFSIHNSRRTVDIIDGPKDRLGEHADRYEDMDQYHSLLCAGCNQLNDCCTIYRRFIIERKMFHSLIYTKRRNSNSYFVQYWMNNDTTKIRFGVIKFFFTYRQEGHAVMDHYPVNCLYSQYFKESKYYDLLRRPLDSLFFVLEKYSRSKHLVNTSWIKSHCIVIEMNNTLLVTPASTYDEHD